MGVANMWEALEDIMKEDGNRISLKDMELSNGEMAIDIKGTLRMGWSKAKAHMFGQMDQVIKEIGIMVKFMEMEHISIVMEGFMKDNGNRIWCMGSVLINGKMVVNILVHMNLIKNVVMVNIIGMMGKFMRDFGQKVKEMAMEEWFIQAEISKKESGRMIRDWKRLKLWTRLIWLQEIQ